MGKLSFIQMFPLTIYNNNQMYFYHEAKHNAWGLKGEDSNATVHEYADNDRRLQRTHWDTISLLIIFTLKYKLGSYETFGN